MLTLINPVECHVDVQLSIVLTMHIHYSAVVLMPISMLLRLLNQYEQQLQLFINNLLKSNIPGCGAIETVAADDDGRFINDDAE